MRILFYIFCILVVVFSAASLYVRLAPVDPERWHVDPETVTPPSAPNFALLAGNSATIIDAPPPTVAARVQAIAEADGAQVVAGSVGEGFVTYVVRSQVMGFPDFISIRLTADGDTTQLHIFARAAYGYSDLGVNTRRAYRWLTAARGE